MEKKKLKSLNLQKKKEQKEKEKKEKEEEEEPNQELYHLYIEMKKRNIKNEKIFEKYVLKPLSDLLPVEDIKIYYSDSIIQLLEITRKEDKSLILDYANKSFEGVKKLKQIKIEQAEILKEFFENDSLKR